MNNPTIIMDMRWSGMHGIGRFAREVFSRLPDVQPLRAKTALFNPFDPILLSARLYLASGDVFYSPGFNAPVMERMPIVLTVHDLNYVYFAENSSAAHRAYFNAIVRPACRRAVRVLTVSAFSKQQIVEWAHVPEDAVVNVGVGVDGGFCPSGVRYDPGYPYLLAFGNGRRHKNIHRLIEAFLASDVSKGMHLLIVGRLDEASVRLIDAKKCASIVHVLADVPEENLVSIYRGAYALCMPSLHEGFGLPVLEAMASGIPVLASNVTSIPEVTNGAALLVDPTSVEAIAAGLGEIVTNDELRASLVARGLERSRAFTWDRTAESISQVLHQACVRSRH